MKYNSKYTLEVDFRHIKEWSASQPKYDLSNSLTKAMKLLTIISSTSKVSMTPCSSSCANCSLSWFRKTNGITWPLRTWTPSRRSATCAPCMSASWSASAGQSHVPRKCVPNWWWVTLSAWLARRKWKILFSNSSLPSPEDVSMELVWTQTSGSCWHKGPFFPIFRSSEFRKTQK